MYVYLSKKIAIPNGTRLASLDWNGLSGWICCGGEEGLLKACAACAANTVGPLNTAVDWFPTTGKPQKMPLIMTAPVDPPGDA